VSRYPGITHTFVVGEVQALRRRGVRIETASVRRVADDHVLHDLDRAERAATRVLVPASARQLWDAHSRAFVRAPRAYVRTFFHALRTAHAGGRPRVWQFFYFGEAILLWRWMKARRLHHVHVHHANVGSDVAMLACAYATSTGERWTWSLTVHGPTELVDVDSHKLAMKAADAAAVVCISDFARSQVAALTGPLPSLHTVRCGIDVQAFAPAQRVSTGFEVLCVAALSRRKGVDVLLEAFAEVLAARPDARLTVAGDGEEAGALRAQADALGIAAAVEFTGAVAHDRVVDLYHRADVYCLPSFSEGVPTVLMEAMATDLPVVATAVGGVSELVDEIVVPPARPDRIAEALLRLAADAELRRRLGTQGRERVLRDYNRDINAAALHEVLAPLIADPAQGE
jgi:colanic acid/amylovoran biosynthesis glycosyltransferase